MHVCNIWKSKTFGCHGYLTELLSQSLLSDSQRSHPSDAAGCLNLIHIKTLHPFLRDQLEKNAVSGVKNVNM